MAVLERAGGLIKRDLQGALIILLGPMTTINDKAISPGIVLGVQDRVD